MIASNAIFNDRIRSMGEGNVFTGVCLFTRPFAFGGGSAWRGLHRRGSAWRGGLHEGGGASVLRGQILIGTHPTGMHSCMSVFSPTDEIYERTRTPFSRRPTAHLPIDMWGSSLHVVEVGVTRGASL